MLGNVAKQLPEVRTWTEAATLEQLHSCAETGALCAIEVDGQRAGIIAAATGQVAPEERNPDDPNTWGKVGRNEACPCGSGKKFKHCHGAFV